MNNKKVVDVTAVDVFGYKISRFRLEIRNKEYSVSMTEEAPGVLVAGFNRGIPLSLVMDTNEEPCVMKVVQYPCGSPATSADLERAFGSDLSADDHWDIIAILQLVGRTFVPDLCISGPDRRKNGDRAALAAVLSITDAPSLAII